jgi:hypothetical protein
MAKTYERELVTNILRKNKREAIDEDYEKEASMVLVMKDE